MCGGPKFRQRLAVGGLVEAAVPVAVQDSTPPPLGRNLHQLLLTVIMRQSMRNELRFAPAERAAMVSVTYDNWLYRHVHVPYAKPWWMLEPVAQSPPE